MRSNPLSILAIVLYCWLNPIHGQEAQPEWKQEIQDAIDETNSAVREAFLKGDLATISKYHHPDVTKALAFDNIVNNREEAIEGLRQTMSQFDMEFMDDRKTEKIHIRKDMVMMQAQFALKLTPKNGDSSFVYRGRTLLVYVPCPESPTGWGTLHEMIQPGQ
ncbi:MAG: nuclear transport factor 2 family protein [Bacteroidota bacterium]